MPDQINCEADSNQNFTLYPNTTLYDLDSLMLSILQYESTQYGLLSGF